MTTRTILLGRDTDNRDQTAVLRERGAQIEALRRMLLEAALSGVEACARDSNGRGTRP